MIRKSVLQKTNTSKNISQIDSHICSLDLEKASKPLSRITSDEYIRALNDLKILRSTPTHSYTIDDKYIKDPEDCSKITFEQWLGRKSQLSKSSKQLEKLTEKQKAKAKKEAKAQQYIKHVQGEEVFKEWAKMKMIQHSSTEKMRIKNKTYEKNIMKEKKKVAKEKYKEWLKKSLKELKKLKIIEKKEKVKEEKEQERKESELASKIEKAKVAYEEWLSKKKTVNKTEEKVKSKQQKSKKIIILAYSPNRKNSFSISNLEALTSQVFSAPNAKSVPNTSRKEKITTPKFYQVPSDEDQVLEELSSIRKSPKVQNTYRFSEEPISFISTGNHELD